MTSTYGECITSNKRRVIVLIMNIPLFILAWRKLNRDFAIYSLIGTALFSVFLTLTSLIVIKTGITNILLASVLLRGKVAITIPTIGFIINGFTVVIGMLLTSV